MSKNSPKIVASDARVNRFLLISMILTGLFGLILFAGIAHAVTLPNECPGSLSDYNVIEGTEGDDTLVGTSGQDYIIGKGGNDTINGGGGNDCIQADGGSDNITTGSGSDVILVGGNNNVINAGDGNNVVISGSGRDNITTGSGDDIIVAGDGNNSIRAGGGNDTITTGSGNDYINGGDGSDSCSAGGGKNIIQKCESVDETPSGNPENPEEEVQPGPIEEETNNGGGDTNTDPVDDPIDDEESSEGSGGNNDQNQPTVGNGIVLNSGGGVPPIEIREENLTSINKNLVRLTWKTNIPATSQVIYDTVSHPELGGPPQYSYAFKTVENQYLTTTHSVEVGGLDPEKSYYFRPVSDVSNSTEDVGVEIVVEGIAFEEQVESGSEDVAAGLLADEALTLASAGGDISFDKANSDQSGVVENAIERTGENGVLAVKEPGALDPDDEAKLALAASATSFGGSQIFLIMLAVIAFAIIFMVAGKRDKDDDQELGIRN
jgi:hypothetical protein